MTKLIIALGFLSLNFYTYNYFASEAIIPARDSFADFPLELGEWSCPALERMERSIEQQLGVTDYLMCTFVRDGVPVGVYVGYHENQHRVGGKGSAESSIHPPKHCLPGSGWDIIGAEKRKVDLPGLPEQPSELARLLIAKGDLRQIVYYWYQERGRVIADDWKKPIFVFWDRATRRRSDGSLVRFTIPISKGPEEHADQQFLDLARVLLPHLSRYVPE